MIKKFLKKWWKIIAAVLILIGIICLVIFKPSAMTKLLSKQIDNIIKLFKDQNEITKPEHAIIDKSLENVHKRIKEETPLEKEKREKSTEKVLQKLYKKWIKENNK